MRPATFEYHKAESLEHALSLLAELGEEARPLAGGQSLVPMMNLRLARPQHLVDINGLGLDAIETDGDILRIGALVRHERYLREPAITRHFPAFLEGVKAIGHPTIRRNGTIGGSLAHADPTAELPLLAMLYGASIVVRSAAGERRIPSDTFFEGAYMTALGPGEMITAAEFPMPVRGAASAFVEMAERKGDFAIAAAAISLVVGSGRIDHVVAACSGAAQKPMRATSLEELLAGRSLDDPVEPVIAEFASSLSPPDDHNASADYRRALIGELFARAFAMARARAQESQ